MSEPDLDAFYAGRRSGRMPFVVNDSVRVLAGPLEGKHAAVISPEMRDGRLDFLVESGDGSGDSVVRADALELTE